MMFGIYSLTFKRLRMAQNAQWKMMFLGKKSYFSLTLEIPETQKPKRAFQGIVFKKFWSLPIFFLCSGGLGNLKASKKPEGMVGEALFPQCEAKFRYFCTWGQYAWGP